MTDARLSRADAARAAMLDAALGHAAFDGWSAAVLERAAGDAGYSAGEAALYCPGGVLDLIETWSANADAAAHAIIAAAPSGKVRERIANAVMTRLDQHAGHEDAARRARARLLLPDGLDRGRALLWASSDMIWRAIGDQSTDANYYSKRTILAAVYASALAVWLEDDDPEKLQTRAFLDRRIENVMEFEKLKGRWRSVEEKLPDPVRILGALRYGFARR